VYGERFISNMDGQISTHSFPQQPP
jgi:hypothetical protein